MSKLILKILNNNFIGHPVTLSVITFGIVIGGWLAFATGTQYISCKSYSEMTERNIKFSLITGCYVNANGKYIPIDEFKRRVTANGATSE